MNRVIEKSHILQTLPSVLLDMLAVGFIYFFPTLSHLLGIPFYLIEPMRVMLILAMTHTGKGNAYILALTMPLFSFMVSGHPLFVKTILITLELVLNAALFYLLVNRMKHIFPAILLSIVMSKAVYYLLKFMLIKMALIDAGLISTPVVVQVVMLLLFSGYVWMFYKRKAG